MANRKNAGKRYSIKNERSGTGASRKKLPRIVYGIIVLVLVAAAILYLFVGKSGGEVSLLENATGSLFSPVQTFFRNVTNSVRDFFSNWHNYGKLQDEYEALSLENEQMKMELVNAEEALNENGRLKELLDARSTYDSLDPIYAKVIARDAGSWFKTFSVNRGTASGVSVGMAVANGDGLIGRVTEVGLNYAKVISIIDARSAVACLMQRTRDNGVLRGQIEGSNGTNECTVSYLPDINSISPGDTVVTSGTDSLYPKGIRIGIVTAVSLEASADGTYAIVTPSVDFHHIEEVFILRTVIESDTDVLPNIATPEAEYQQSAATPRPNTKATPTPEPTQDVDTDTWHYPTSTPAPGEANPYADFKIGELIEDDWASGETAN